MAEDGADGLGKEQAAAKKAGEKKASGGLMHRVKTIALIVLIVLVVIIALQNMASVAFKILWWPPVQMPLALMLLVAFVLGGLAGAGGFMLRLKHKSR